MHTLISNKISTFLDKYYYNNIKIPIFKLEYYIYIQSYITYLFFYYLNNNNIILYSISLHFIHICSYIFKDLSNKYSYTSVYNINFLKDINYLLFSYLLYFKIFFLDKNFYKKGFILTIISIFHLLANINYIYNKRLKSIENNNEFKHFYKFLVITPDKNKILKIINYTKRYNYSFFLIIINIMLFLFF